MAFTPPTYAAALPIVRAQAPKKKQQDSSPLSGFLDAIMPNIGLDEALKNLIHIPGGLYNLATGGGDLQHYGDTWKGFGGGMLKSFANTGATALRPFGIPFTDINLSTPYKAAIGDVAQGLGETSGWKPKDLFERAYDHGQQGLIPAIIEDVGNVALAGGATAKLAKAGELGQVANAAATAGRAEAGLGAASDAAKAAAKIGGADALEAAKASIPADVLAKRIDLLNKLNAVEHPYNTLFQQGIRPLTRAADLANRTANEVQMQEFADAAAKSKEPAPVFGPPKPPEAGPPTPGGPIGEAPAPPDQIPQPNPNGTRELPPMPEAPASPAALQEAERLRQQAESLRAQVRNANPAAAPNIDHAQVLDAANQLDAQAAELSKSTPIKMSDREQRFVALNNSEISPWAQNAVQHLPQGLRDVLSGAEGFIQRRQIGRIAHDRELAMNAAQRQFIRDYGSHAGGIAQELVRRGNGEITRDLANEMVGKYIRDQIEGVDATRNAVEDATGKVIENKLALPPELVDSKMQQSLDAAVESYRQGLKLQEEARLNGRLGGKGLENIGSDAVDLGKKGRSLQKEIDQLNEEITSLREKKLPKQVARAERELAAAEAKLTSLNQLRDSIAGGNLPDASLTESVRLAKQQQQVVDSIRQTLADNAFDAARKAQNKEAMVATRQGKLNELISNPSKGRVPRQWQHAWIELKTMMKDPEVADALGGEGWANNFQAFVQHMRAKGVEPQYIQDLSHEQVQRLVHSTLSMNDIGHEIVGGFRSKSGGKLYGTEQHAVGIDALVASMVDTMREQHQNALVTYIEQAHAIPAVRTPEGKVADGYVMWSPTRKQFFPLAKGAASKGGLMIPAGVDRFLKSNMTRINSPWLKTLATVTKPWRMFALLLSPKWLVNNFAGNMFLALADGARVQDFMKAYRAWKGEDVAGFGMNARFTGEAAGGASGIAGHSFMSDVTDQGSLVPHQPKLAGAKEAYTEGRTGGRLGGVRDLKDYGAHKIGRANEVVDEMARAAVYFKELRTGARHDQALLHAQQALVDFTDLSPLEQNVVRQIIPFYAWQKGILKVVARAAVDNPKVMAIYNALAEADKSAQRANFGPDLPEAYQGLIKTPFGDFNTRALNPLADSGSLLSPEGTVSSINPFVQAYLRQGFHAPASGYADKYTIDPYGRAVPDVNMGESLTSTFTSLPLARLANNLGAPVSSSPSKGALGGIASYLGSSQVDQATISKAQARLQKSLKAQANKAGKGAKKAPKAKGKSKALAAPKAPKMLKLKPVSPQARQSLAQKIAQRKALTS